MKRTNLRDPELYTFVMEVLNSDFPVFIIEFPNVYGLMAANSIKGVNAMNKVKSRLPNKYYSTFLGDSSSFRKLMHPELAQIYDCINDTINGAFFRFPLKEKTKRSNYVDFNGCHQFLIEDGALRAFVTKIERLQLAECSTSDFFSTNYQAPIISSLNKSGSKAGVITSEKEAVEFGIKNFVPLFIENDYGKNKGSSYPIFSVNISGKFLLERDGPSASHISYSLQRLNEELI